MAERELFINKVSKKKIKKVSSKELKQERTKEKKKLSSLERKKIHHSFDIYDDQLTGLKQKQVADRIDGKKKLLSEYVREALDNFLKK